MNHNCEVTRQSLVELAGDEQLLDTGDQEHLLACAACRQVAAFERKLARALEWATPPEDVPLQAATVAAVGRLRSRRRLWSLIPVAASALVALVGVVLAGGVPGRSLLALVPLWSSQGWLALASVANDWIVVLTTTAQAAQAAIPSSLQVAAAGIATVGSAVVTIAARRWRRVAPWRREH